MTSIIKLAMIVLMARRDLRFFSIRFFAHFAGFILSSSLQCFLGRAARLRLGSSSQTCQRVLTIKPHCFSRPFSSVPASAVHSDQVPASGRDRFVTQSLTVSKEVVCHDSSTNVGEASHGYEVGREKVNTLAEQARFTSQTRAERTKIPSRIPCRKTRTPD